MHAQGSVRRYHCARCHRPVLICSHCDHGHIYCFEGCREQADKERRRRNAKRYQSSPKGRRNNAQRQCRHRERHRSRAPPDAIDSVAEQVDAEEPLGATDSTHNTEKVTHHGSPPQGGSVVLPGTRNTGASMHCDCCERACSAYVRVDYLRTRCRYRTAVP